MTPESHRLQVHRFEYGEAYDDLRTAFVIDERDYPDAAHAQADIASAHAALKRAGVIFEVEVSASPASRTGIGGLTWQEFRQRHFIDGVPLPVRPMVRNEVTPPSWQAMNEELARASEHLEDELMRLNTEAFPNGRTEFLERRGPLRLGPGSVHMHEERFGFVVGVDSRIGSVSPEQAMHSAAEVYKAAGWRLGPLRGNDTELDQEGERDLFVLQLASKPDFLMAYVFSPLYSAPPDEATFRMERRPDTGAIGVGS